jgi:outer membrane protein assembly factor BamB
MLKTQTRYPLFAYLAFLGCWTLPSTSLGDDLPALSPSGFLQQSSLPLIALPTRWNGESIAWKAEIDGYGQSMPIVHRGMIYVTSVAGNDKDECVITCFDNVTGHSVWQYRQPSSHRVESGPMVSRAAPTPVCDNSAIYAFFETGDLICLSHTGSLIWCLDLQKELGSFENKFGLSASVAQLSDHIFLLLDHEGESSIAAVNKSDGTLHWKSNRGSRSHNWSSPAVIHVDDVPVIVCSSPGAIDAYSATTGELLANYNDVGGNSVATPIDLGEGRFLVASLVRPADGPSRGALTSNMMLQLSVSEEGYRFKKRWVADNARGSFASPIRHREECYFLNPQGVVYCVDAETGKEHYSQRLPCGGCWATPIAWGELIYFFGRDGKTTVLRAGPKFEVVAEDNMLKPDDSAIDSLNEGENPLARNSQPSLYATVVTNEGLVFRFGSSLLMVPLQSRQ